MLQKQQKEQCIHHQIGPTLYIQTGKSLVNSLQMAVRGAPAYNPRLQTDTIIISFCAKIQLCFNFYKLLQCCSSLFHLVSHKTSQNLGGWPGPQGLKRDSKTHSLSYLKCCLACCACRQARNPSRVQVSQEQVRGLLSCF